MVEHPVHTRVVICSSQIAATRPVGQKVKTPPFHGGNMGSIPVRVTKNLQSIEIAGFSCIFSALRHLGRSAFQKRKMPIKNAHEFPALQPSHKFFFQQPKQPYRKRNLSAIIAHGRFSRLREPFPPAHRLTITRPPQRAHSTRSPLRRGLCASELQISEKGVTLWDLSTQHWAPPAA